MATGDRHDEKRAVDSEKTNDESTAETEEQSAAVEDFGEVVLFSACQDGQESWTPAKSGGTTGGFMFSFIERLELSDLQNAKHYNFAKLLKKIYVKVTSSTDEHPQTPLFSTCHPFNLDSPFIL